MTAKIVAIRLKWTIFYRGQYINYFYNRPSLYFQFHRSKRKAGDNRAINTKNPKQQKTNPDKKESKRYFALLQIEIQFWLGFSLQKVKLLKGKLH